MLPKIQETVLTACDKGWACCKPRVLTFDEFLSIPPCTIGKHSTVDDTPQPSKPTEAPDATRAADTPFASQGIQVQPTPVTVPRIAQQLLPERPTPSPQPPEESSDDDPSLDIPDGAKCRRRGCSARYAKADQRSRESCVYHPGAPIFHEGSKGYSCCKRRVLEFDEFMRIEGCRSKDRHLFVGSGKKRGANGEVKKAGRTDGEEEQGKLGEVRTDFYQTPTQVIASIYLKKIDRDKSGVEFKDENTVDLDLKTQDGKKYTGKFELYGAIDPEKSTYRISPAKLELTLAKADGYGWPVLKADDTPTGEIIQSGRAGRV